MQNKVLDSQSSVFVSDQGDRVEQRCLFLFCGSNYGKNEEQKGFDPDTNAFSLSVFY